MAWHFLSYELSDKISGYAGGDQIKVKKSRSICCGDTSNNSEFWMPTHFGTHLDYPFHFSAQGKTGTDYVAKDFIFDNVKAFELDMRERRDKLILPDDIVLESDDKLDALIVNTRYSEKRYDKDYWLNGPGFHVDTASKLKEKFKNLKLIGFDSISLTNFQNREHGRKAHKAFLIDHNLMILEDMDLSCLNGYGKINKMIVAPLRLLGADGAPATVLVESLS